MMLSLEAAQSAARRAAQAWPELDAQHTGQFFAHLQGLLVKAEHLEIHGTELFLSHACALGNAAALRTFEREYFGLLGDAVARIDRNPAFVDEVRQEVLERLFVGEHPRIAQYTGTGSLAAWLRVVAMRTALNRTKSDGRHKEVLTAALIEPQVSQPSDVRSYAAVVEAALEEGFSLLSARERNVLRMSYMENANIDQIGALYGVHRATVARWLASARRQVLEHIEKRVRGEMKLSDSELHSVLAGVRSQLQLSVTRLLVKESSVAAL